ncbi:prolipoprotein diacylglyceryl transferase [Actinomadura alba]|uniref:Phosphatidylglycerol--prolipoprotein diacylglyceryl transferase n=1 Tax=Actinomadura alba TaxID=406431 RepID=A0ABR7LWH5_9ACTN|nr:prolipoprotein diacylglyceryl transferase [Actinomadura alba]MBC6469201.1 prolipoprotein diacylglyceryl transferase [Actinomadura alba]
MQPLASLPSPSDGVWHLGPLPLRAYALMIIIGIVVAIWLGERRWTARGGTPNVVVDVAVWTVPFGLVGGRLYHVITDYERYFGDGQDPVNVLKIWHGGLGIWGAIALGAVGAWIGCRRRGISLGAFGDAVAPGIALAQAIGRWGNWWNQELYGKPLNTWWAVKIDAAHRPADPKYADIATYHPTFLYESLWCVGVAVLVIWAGRRFRLTHGRTFALYVAAYTVGRFWIESLRIDDAHHLLGMRLNNWTALIVFIGAVAYLWQARGRAGGEEAVTVAAAGVETASSTADTADPVPAGSVAAPAAVQVEKSASGSPQAGPVAVATDERETPPPDAPDAPVPGAPESATADEPVAPGGETAGAATEQLADQTTGAATEQAADEAAGGDGDRDPEEPGDESGTPAVDEPRPPAQEDAAEGDSAVAGDRSKTAGPSAEEAADKEPS